MISRCTSSSLLIAGARRFIEAVEETVSQRNSFVCESTLAGLTIRNVIDSAREAGYLATIAFLFVDSPDVCVARIAERVRKGGHDVPEPDVRRRFTRSIQNFWHKYRELVDNWVLLYNGMTTLQDVAAGARENTVIRDSELFSTYLHLVGVSR